MQTFSLAPVDLVDVTLLVDNSFDALIRDGANSRRFGLYGTAGKVRDLHCGIAADGRAVDLLHAEHGFSALIEVRSGDNVRRVLFDAGSSPNGLVDNLDRLSIDPGTFLTAVLSHGHFDHVMGLDGLSRRLGRRRMPILLHPDFWTRRRNAVPAGGYFDLPVASRAAVEDVGFEIVEDRQPSFLLDGSLLVTGEIDRTTTFEKGSPIHQAWRDGAWQPDPMIYDDQAVILHVLGKGLVILTGCSHAGLVNIVRHAKRLTGVQRIHAVFGGFHLSGGVFEALIPETVKALAAEDPDLIVPGHCTGWKAQFALSDALPDAYCPSAVGSRFQLRADAASKTVPQRQY